MLSSRRLPLASSRGRDKITSWSSVVVLNRAATASCTLLASQSVAPRCIDVLVVAQHISLYDRVSRIAPSAGRSLLAAELYKSSHWFTPAVYPARKLACVGSGPRPMDPPVTMLNTKLKGGTGLLKTLRGGLVIIHP